MGRIAIISGLVACAIIGGQYYHHRSTVAGLQSSLADMEQRATTAEASLAVALTEKQRLTDALEAQERATQDALAHKQVIYRTVQKEIAKDENARDWYNASVPAGIVRLLKGNANGVQND